MAWLWAFQKLPYHTPSSYNPVADHHQWLYANCLSQSQALEGLVDLVEQLLFPLQQAQLPLALFFAAGDIGLVGGAFLLPQLAELVVDALLQFLALADQQVTEERLLSVVQVGLGRQGQQFIGSHDGLEFDSIVIT